MTKEIFEKFKDNVRAFLYCDELNIRIKNSAYDNPILSLTNLFAVQKYPNSPKVITFYMTEHMILKAFKNDEFILGEFSRGA